MADKPKVRSVFGKTIDVDKLLEAASASQLAAIQPSLLALENEDPAYVYAWLEAKDPETSRLVRKGLYEMVDPNTDPVVAAGADSKDKEYRVNELVLCRQKREQYEARKALAVRRHVHREMATEEQYKAMVQRVARAIVPGETGDPYVEVEKGVSPGPVGKKPRSKA